MRWEEVEKIRKEGALNRRPQKTTDLFGSSRKSLMRASEGDQTLIRRKEI
jgi:hypothetical protein